MRWLIVGPYPPERGSGSAAATRFVRDRLDAGDEVRVVSPRPSAAHEHRRLVGWRGLVDLIRSLDGFDGLWLRLEPGFALSSQPSRHRALLDRGLLRLALTRVERSTIDVGDVGMLPGGRAGRLVLGGATTFVVSSRVERDALIAAGAAPGSVELRPEQAEPGRPVPVAEPTRSGESRREIDAMPVPEPTMLLSLAVGAGRADLEAAIRARATEAPVSREGRR